MVSMRIGSGWRWRGARCICRPWTGCDEVSCPGRTSIGSTACPGPVLRDAGAEGFDSAAREEAARPRGVGATAGMASTPRLASSGWTSRFTVATLSNGNRAQQAALIQFAGLPFQRVLSAEDFRHYKPDPEVYVGAASALGLKPVQVMMVASHKSDLRAAQAVGLHAAFVERPLEKGPGGGAFLCPIHLAVVQAADFLDLADKLGC